MRGCGPDSVRHVNAARYLVQEWGADPWKGIFMGVFRNDDGKAEGEKEEFVLFLHAAAVMGAHTMVAFFVEECGMPVDTVTGSRQMTPLHMASVSFMDEADEVQIPSRMNGVIRTTSSPKGKPEQRPGFAIISCQRRKGAASDSGAEMMPVSKMEESQ